MSSSRTIGWRAVLAVSAAALSGCATHTAFQPPATHMPARYAQADASVAAAAPGQDWWRRFGDARLDALVAQALARNNDLAQAAIAVRRARVEAGLSVINPTVAANLSASSSKTLRRNGVAIRSYGSDLTVGYEADLFGRLAATRDAADFEARATAEDYAAARLSLIATTATLYYQLAFLNERIGLAQESVAYARKTLDLVDVQRGAGAASNLEIAEAQQSLHSQQATLEDLVRQRVAARNAIALLLDGQPWTGGEPARTPDEALPPVAAGVPAELLGRRPDLRAAELRLREQLAQVDATRASFYPRLTLTGQLGGSSAALTELMKNPVGVVAANLAAPFLQVNEMRLSNQAARLAYESAAIDFRQTLYQALADVENALADRSQYAAEARLSGQSLAEARTVERLNEVRYRAGSTTLKVWLDAQESRRQAEATWASSVLNARLAQITLYKALGGDA
jgi:NodT family efflux transporter outer membrane factor (OMF) lipoprotein